MVWRTGRKRPSSTNVPNALVSSSSSGTPYELAHPLMLNAVVGEDGRKRRRVLGRRSQMTKSEALRELAKIVGPLNSRESPPSNSWLFGDFTRQVYLPFYRRKWKR